jgi:hypothetical protein
LGSPKSFLLFFMFLFGLFIFAPAVLMFLREGLVEEEDNFCSFRVDGLVVEGRCGGMLIIVGML